MNALNHLPLHDREVAAELLGELIAEQAGLAISAGREPTVAVSSRIAVSDLGAALEKAFDAWEGLRQRVHLFSSDLCISAPCDRREEMRSLQSRLRLHARQLHLPAEGGDVHRTARAFEAEIRSHFRLPAGEAPTFDTLCLAPADLGAPRHADASDRLATGVYNVVTGQSAVSLSVASLVGSRAVASYGPDGDARGKPRLPNSLVSRALRLHWLGGRPRGAFHAAE